MRSELEGVTRVGVSGRTRPSWMTINSEHKEREQIIATVVEPNTEKVCRMTRMRRNPPRSLARRARRRIKKAAERELYFKDCEKRQIKRLKLSERIYDGDDILVPDADCSSYCMRDWAERKKRYHEKEPMSECDAKCLARFAAYRFCQQVVTVCSFCRLPDCECVEDSTDSENGEEEAVDMDTALACPGNDCMEASDESHKDVVQRLLWDEPEW